MSIGDLRIAIDRKELIQRLAVYEESANDYVCHWHWESYYSAPVSKKTQNFLQKLNEHLTKLNQPNFDRIVSITNILYAEVTSDVFIPFKIIQNFAESEACSLEIFDYNTWLDPNTETPNILPKTNRVAVLAKSRKHDSRRFNCSR